MSRLPRSAVLRLISACLALGLLVHVRPAQAQQQARAKVEDRAVPDADSLRSRPQQPVSDVLISRPVPTPDDVIGSLPGVFPYWFGSAGWPNAPSPYGVDPAYVLLSVDGHAWDDLVLGRPRYDLAPAVLLTRVGLDGPFAAVASTDPLAVSAPLTRIRYTSTGDGLQEARVLHVQDRTLPVSIGADSTGPAPRLNLVFGYEGAGAANEYPGSTLRRARRVIGRVAVRSSTWEFVALNIANRRRVGSHGGVEPIAGRGSESIFQRLGADVTDPDHARRTTRNDLLLRAAHDGGAGSESLNLFWTSQTQSFDNGLTLDRWEVHRIGAVLDASRRPAPIRNPSWSAGIDASITAESPGEYTDSLFTFGDDRDNRLLAGGGVRIGFDSGYVGVSARAGAGYDDGRVSPDLSAGLRLGVVNVSASWAGRPDPWIDRVGFFEYAAEAPDSPDTRTLNLFVSARASVGPIDIEPSASFTRETYTQVRVLDSTATSSTVTVFYDATTRMAASLRFGINDRGSDGLYLSVTPTIHSADLDDTSVIARAWKEAVPGVWLDGRVGFRRLMFKGDLDLDAYVRGRAWSEMRGRRLHTPTGLLMLAPDGSGTVGSSGVLDLVAEAGVRGATIILAWENALSGTSVHAGNLLVPDYPLPAQRLRFGVYWPISN